MTLTIDSSKYLVKIFKGVYASTYAVFYGVFEGAELKYAIHSARSNDYVSMTGKNCINETSCVFLRKYSHDEKTNIFIVLATIGTCIYSFEL